MKKPKIVKKILALVVATSFSLPLFSCAINNKNYRDENKEEVVASESFDNNQEETIIDNVEIYKTISERNVKIEDCKALYSQLEIERQHFDELMINAFENPYVYSENARTQLVDNTVKVYYDMACLLSSIYRAIKELPETIETEIQIKIDELTKLNETYNLLITNQRTSERTWSGQRILIDDNQIEDILQFVNLFQLAKRGVGGQYGTNYIEKDLQELNDALEELNKNELGV